MKLPAYSSIASRRAAHDKVPIEAGSALRTRMSLSSSRLSPSSFDGLQRILAHSSTFCVRMEPQWNSPAELSWPAVDRVTSYYFPDMASLPCWRNWL